MIIWVSFATLFSTLLGGSFALRFKDKLHLILGFSAGAVIGVAFFDLLPEALELGMKNFSASVVTSVVALGFVVYTLLDRFIFLHSHEETEEGISKKGVLGVGSFAVHSFLDGVAIGLAFQVSGAVGAIVSVAVLVHDFSDGINTVNMVIKNSGTRREAWGWLLIDAAAPVIGVLTTLFYRVPESTIGLILAMFCGFFLYIGAADLLPESQHSHPTAWTTFATILGIAVLYGAIQLAGL